MTTTWEYLIQRLRNDFSIPGNLLSVLFLVGIQESGGGFRSYDQQEKTDLIKLGKYTLLSRDGYFKKITIPGRDPLFITVERKPLPEDPKKVNQILKNEILRYFEAYTTNPPL